MPRLLRQPAARRRRFVLALLLLGALPLLALYGLGAWIERWGRVERATPAAAIVVFGARVQPGGAPSTLLYFRSRHAFELWKRGFAPKIVCTGGVGDNPPAESIVETALLERWGVPASAILREERSTSTRENAQFAAALLPHGAHVIAVSDPFHLLRCRRDLERVGLVATTSPALAGWDALPPQTRLFYCLREAISTVRDWVLG